MTVLKNKITRLIETQGPISVSQFMSLCLADPEHGYYIHENPFGTRGDFTTAPEISQMFGEMLALWAIDRWQTHGAPSPFIFCEMGPGRGTLMDDMIRTLAKICPDFLNSARIILVETSQRLREQIKKKLKPHKIDIIFVDHILDLPPLPLILIANEFLDCLPIHQYCRTVQTYVERMVGLDGAGNLCFINGLHSIDLALLPEAARKAPIGAIIEYSPAREACIQTLSHHLLQYGGTVVFIDYGSLESGFGDTLQALSQHQFAQVFEQPGRHDLTSHVDFATLGLIAKRLGCETMMTTQGAFLTSLGIEIRAHHLGRGQEEDFQQKLAQDVERLIGDEAMGKLFKILIISKHV